METLSFSLLAIATNCALFLACTGFIMRARVISYRTVTLAVSRPASLES